VVHIRTVRSVSAEECISRAKTSATAQRVKRPQETTPY
jgi:hypothetical protein